MPHPLLILALLATAAAARPVATVASPDGRARVSVRLDAAGAPVWQVSYDGHTVLDPSPAGLVVAGQDLATGLRWLRASAVEAGAERYQLWTGPRQHVVTAWRQVSVTLGARGGGRLVIDLRAADGGVALRYRVPPPPGYAGVPVRVDEDRLAFAFTPGRAWLQPYHRASDYTPAYEDYFQAVAIGDPPGPSRGPQPPLGWAFGGLYALAGDRVWALSVEAGGGPGWGGSHLSAGTDGPQRLAWPAADEFRRTVPRLAGSDPRPQTTLPLTSPWRGLALAAGPEPIATTTWPTDLAAPCELADTSWIRPGRASWSWLSTPERFDREVFEQFLDFGAEFGWEYSLLDAGWWNLPLDELTRAAAAQNVRVFLWGDSTEHYDPPDQARRMAEAQAAGVAGFKIDFWCSDKPYAYETMQNLLRRAAEHELCIVLHGCTLPRGWQRTWPNLLSAEAVLGAETYHFEADFGARSPSHHAILPFTRNAVAPMDYTPTPLEGSPWPHVATAAHQFALPIVQTSGLMCLGGQPAWYAQLPAGARDLLAALPSVWDESRCLVGVPGELVVMARRSGAHWWLAALNGTAQSREVTLDLTELGLAGGPATILRDGPAGAAELVREPLGAATRIHLAPAGGWVGVVRSSHVARAASPRP